MVARYRDVLDNADAAAAGGLNPGVVTQVVFLGALTSLWNARLGDTEHGGIARLGARPRERIATPLAR